MTGWLLHDACVVAKTKARGEVQYAQLERLRRILLNAEARCREKDQRDEAHRAVQKAQAV